MERRFAQLDVFTDVPLRGNPLAVVVDGDGLSDDEMARFANWTNLSETTFLLPPTDPSGDYRVRIFTTAGELPFAGHPTIGSCRAWLDHGGVPATPGTVVQECGVGLVSLQLADDRLAFAAPPLLRSGTVEATAIAEIEAAIGVDVLDAAWADNGPGWIAVEVADAATVRSIEPDFRSQPHLKLGVVGRETSHDGRDLDYDVEVRAFFPGAGSHFEDPVTGSLNAAVAMWLMERDPDLQQYVARQGSNLGRDGRVHLRRDGDTIWVGGDTVTLISGAVTI